MDTIIFYITRYIPYTWGDINRCMLFYDNDDGKKDAALLQCKFCHTPRYHPINPTKRNQKPIPMKYMFYLPLIPRLQRLYASMQTAPHMTWHHERRNDTLLCHPSDGEAWKYFDRKHPTFAAEARNVRLGLCSDGFNPYIQASSSPYSC